MYYSDKALKTIQHEYETVNDKFEKLFIRYTHLQLTSSKAQEYAKHGFSRRLKILARCIDNAFIILPPNRAELPTDNERSDATINIQAFVFNVFGSLDNLAWIWVKEKNITEKSGAPLSKSQVGLATKYKIVRASFSTQFQEYLKNLDPWFDHQENFRHALAHRIPFYIPPGVITKSKEADFLRFNDLMVEAFNRQDYREHDRLSAEQMKLGVFTPWILHSLEEGSGPVQFHPKLLKDFDTIVALGRNMLQELNC